MISILILSYNREQYLAQAIASVLNQTYPDFELLIWDDGSTDRSMEIAQAYAQQDARVRVMGAPNQGIAKARNAAIAHLKGEYLGWVDSDDWLAPTALEETVALLKAQPKLGMVYTDYLTTNEAGLVQAYGQRCATPYSKERLLLSFMTFHFRLMRRSVFDQIGGIDESFECSYDYDLCLRLSEVTPITHLQRPLYFYRCHSNSVTQYQRLGYIHWSQKAMQKALERRGLSDRYRIAVQLETINGQLEGRFSLKLRPETRRRAIARYSAALLAALPLSLPLTTAAIAQSVRPANDGTGTRVTRDGNRYDIQGGQRSRDGANLFHSFEQLDLSQQEIANFLATPDLQNILGRIGGGSPSYIDGILRITGGNPNLLLMNPAGILFGANAQLDLPAAFTATTATGIGFDGGWFSATGAVDYAALVGNPTSFAFTLAQPGVLVNAGDLAVQPGSALGLLGGLVLNTGTLSAPDGTITLAAVPGENLVRLSQPGSLLSLDFEPIQPGDALPNPTSITPALLPTLLTGGNLDGATGLTVNPDGSVALTGSDVTIPQQAGTAIASGNLDVANADGIGGTIAVLGDRLALLSANLDASGTTGGGNLFIGGNYQGRGSLPNALRTLVDADSVLTADAIATGDGGEVILWADQVTGFYGSISTTGGAIAGDGGFVEVSGAQELLFRGTVDTTAPNGATGTLLLDPVNLTIVEGFGAANDTEVSDGEILSGDGLPGSFTISEGFLEAIPATTNILLEATNDIIIEDLTGGADVGLVFAPAFFASGGSITFRADADNDGSGAFRSDPANRISATGRDISISAAEITVGDIDTSFTAFSASGSAGQITLEADGDITTGTLRAIGGAGSFGYTAEGGEIEVRSDFGDVTIDAIASHSISGAGGDVTIVGDRVQISEFLTIDPVYPAIPANASIYAVGVGGNNGDIFIEFSGGPNNAPFVVGSLTPNGSRGALYTDPTNPLQSGSFAILSSGGDATLPPGIDDITLRSVNEAPTLSGVSDLTPTFSTTRNQAIDIRVSNLLTLSDISDADGDNVRIVITRIPTGGTLTRNGVVLSVGTRVSPGDVLVYTPPDGVTGTVTAFELVAIDLSNGATELSRSGEVLSVSVQITANRDVLPEDDNFPNDPLPDRPNQRTTPPVTVDTPSSSISQVPAIDRDFTSSYTRYLGLPVPDLVTLDEATQRLSEIERATGAKPALVYVSFAPPAIDLLVESPSPQPTDELELIVITREGVFRERIAGVTRSQVLATVQTFQGEVTNVRRLRTTSYLDSSQQLYQWLIEPIQAELQTRKITNLVFLPDAGLRSLPFAALHDGQQFLIENYSVGLMPSLSLTDTLYKDIRDSQVLALGISESTQGQPPLPAVPIELTTLVLNLWQGGRIFLNSSVTRDILLQMQQEQPFGIIHMATHADFVGGDINQSYIQLWNDRLQMDQVRQLGWNDPAVELLVLSACRTALGNEQAELGFAGMAAQTGVKSTIASLWYVNDLATAALMTEFYQFLDSAPIKAQALREAQVAMARGEIYFSDGKLQGLEGINPLPMPSASIREAEQNFSHPYYWAAFTMIGNPW